MTNFRYIDEPSLAFGYNQHVCPRAGITDYQPYDIEQVRRDQINTGIVGKSESIDLICNWIARCKMAIDPKPAKKGKRQNLRLFPGFCGFNRQVGFRCELVYDDTYLRTINNSTFQAITQKAEFLKDRIREIADLYLAEIKYLVKNKRPDVILCVITQELYDFIKEEVNPEEETDENEVGNVYAPQEDEEDEEQELEQDFRRYLKAKAMQFGVPIQIVRDRIAKPTTDMQDEATVAWNFFTAIYYKAGNTPWALIRRDMAETTCYAGISFYRSRDRKSIQTSIAQIFNEQGKGIILRGEEIVLPKYDRTPHLSAEQAFNLLDQSLKEYFDAIKQPPKRLVLHKTSNFSPAEIEGFKQAANKYLIYQVDMVTIMDSDIRLYREGAYPPMRGTQYGLTREHQILYTRGSVPYYETYTGMYIPRPLEVRLYHYDESPARICDEIVALTKMNWNNTQFDRRLPITIDCARNVGDILKYLGEDDQMQLRYSFYM